jgi:O-antigen/teichoic acid export membrane protein
MRNKLISLVLVLAMLTLMVPAALAQDGGRFIRRDKNGIRIGSGAITLFDGPGILNYEQKHRWMEGPAGAATVIGIGAGAGALTGGAVKGKKGAVIGALVGAGAATGLWLYKNRREKRKIF